MRDYSDDIKRYRSGKMTASERHALEREALNDPFLADALEGAEEVTSMDFTADVSKLDRKVEHRIHGPVMLWRQQTARIAAAVLILALATYSIIYLWPDNNPEPLALEQVKEHTIIPQERAASQDSSSAGSTITETNAVSAKQPSSPKRQRAQDVAAPDNAAGPLPLKEGQADAMEIRAEVSGETEPEQAEKEAVGRTPSQQPAVQGLAMHLRSESAKKDDSELLSEVVVAGQQRKPVPLFSATYPEGGLHKYRQYLEQSRQYPHEALAGKVEGRVVIEFVVEHDGSFGNMKIIQGIGSGCDEELMRLIREGPRWMPARQGKAPVRDTVKVSLWFKLPR